jgi:hydrogenase expression/formation protein HypE
MAAENPKKVVQLGHGGGGQMQEELIHFITDNIAIKDIRHGIGVDAFDDGATIPLEDSDMEIVVTADGHTVDPPFFPGGNLGSLSISGTVNDLIMMGAMPIAITSTVFIEEGTEFDFLDKVMTSFNETAQRANVAILAGDTKVLPRKALNGLILATTGIGIRPKSRNICDANCKPGAKIILTGSIGDHGATLIAQRENFDFKSALQSDICALTELIPIIEDTPGIMAMKDPTRGGIAAALNEWSKKSDVSIWIQQNKVKIKREVQSIADILGIDPYEVANEGKALICVEPGEADALLKKIQATTIGKDAEIIGEVKSERAGYVILETPLGGKRIIEKPMGELIPRIC